MNNDRMIIAGAADATVFYVLDLAIRVFEGNAQPQTLDSKSYKYGDILRELRDALVTDDARV